MSVRLPIGKKTCGYRKPVFTMLVTGNFTGPQDPTPYFIGNHAFPEIFPINPLNHWSISSGRGLLEKQVSEISRRFRRYRDPLKRRIPLTCHFIIFFSTNIAISKVVYTKFLDNLDPVTGRTPQAAVGAVGYEWILVFLPVVSKVILCTVHLSWEKAHILLLLVIFLLRSHTFFFVPTLF